LSFFHRLGSLICLLSFYSLFCAGLLAQYEIAPAKDNVPKLLAATSEPQLISLQEALSKALKYNNLVQLANNKLELAKTFRAQKISALLPKIRLKSGYTRNIPEISSQAFSGDKLESSLFGHVASLLRNAGQLQEANQLERQAELALRRNVDREILINPKDVFEGQLAIEMPLFNGSDVAHILASNERISLQEANIEETKAKTLYETTKAYYLANHLKNVLLIRKQAEESAEKRFLKANAKRKRGLIMEKDYLLAQANFLQKQADHQGGELDFSTSIAQLGMMIGETLKFDIKNPDDLEFSAINANAEQLIEIALKNRPDLKAEQKGMQAIEQERLATFMSFLPTLSLTGHANYTSNTKSMTKEKFTYAVSINASISLFEGGSRFFKLQETTLKKKEHEIKLRQLKYDIFLAIRGRKAKLAHLAISEKAAQAKTIATHESELVAKGRYERGLIEHEELLDAIERKLDADIALQKIKADTLIEKLAFTYELGLLTPQLININ
jgi:outer membrane protein TolC